MPATSLLPTPFIRQGQVITADALNKLAKAAGRVCLQPGTFMSGSLLLQALGPSAASSVAASSQVLLQAILIKPMEPARVDGMIGELSPSEVVEEAVYVMGEPIHGIDNMQAISVDGSEPTLYHAVNRAFPDDLWAGTGDENEPPPMMVRGFFATTPDGSGGSGGFEFDSGDVTPLFVIVEVVNPLIIYKGSTTAPVAGGPWDATMLERISGRELNFETLVGVENPDAWEGDGYCLQIVKSDGTIMGIDLACPDEES